MNKEFLNSLFVFLNEEYQKQTGGIFGIDNYDCDEEGNCIPAKIEDAYEIVDKPKGGKQEYNSEYIEEISEKYPFLTYEYVDQFVNGGYSGDNFEGDIYYPLPNGQFMRVPYSC